MSQTLEIPKSSWSSMLEAINRSAQGRPVKLEVESLELGDQQVAMRMPLRELEIEAKGSAAPSLLVTLGDDRYEFSHSVARPAVVSVGYGAPGQIEWVAISGEDGTKTIIQFEELLALPAEAEAPQAT